MKIAAKQTLQRLQRRPLGIIEAADTYTPKKNTTLIRFNEDDNDERILLGRKNYVDLFKQFTREVIPAMERRIESDIMQQQFRTIKNQNFKEAIMQAYLRRVATLRNQQLNEEPILSYQIEDEYERPMQPTNWAIECPVEFLGEDEIGFFLQYPYKELSKYYKHLAPGFFNKTWFLDTGKFAVQLTEEGVKIIDYIRNAARNEKIYTNLANIPDQMAKRHIYNEDRFQVLFGTLRGDFWESIESKYRKDVEMHRMFVNSPVFDSLISTVIIQMSENQQLRQDMANPQKRKEIFDSLADQIKQKMDVTQINSQLPEVLYKTIKELQIGSLIVDTKGLKEKPFTVPESLSQFRFENHVNCGNTMMVYGRGGTGKSGVILQTSLWGHKSGWVVITVPDAKHWTHSVEEFERHDDTGLYMQPQCAQEFLEQITEANKHLFQYMPVNLSLWGKYGYSGQHDDEVEAVPNVYDKRRRYHFKDHEQFIDKEELSLPYDSRLCHKILPEPKNILEIAQAALANPKYCTSAIYEILEQLYKQDKVKVLVAVDGFNWFYRPSGQPSFRYESDKGLRGHVPPQHLSLCRAFMHLDGHKIRNGYKVLASSVYPLFGHTFAPKHIYFSEKYGVELKGLPLDHYRIFCHFSAQNDAWFATPQEQNQIEQLWMETQGNQGETRCVMKYAWRAIV